MTVKEHYQQVYKQEPEFMFDSGGRFEILGNHTDHNHGLCLAATAHLCITCGVSKRNDLIVNFNSRGFPNFSIDLNDLSYNKNDDKSGAMIKGVAKYLINEGYKIGGFDAASISSIYNGAGVSSSAAFQLLVGQIFNELFNDGVIPKMVLCKAGQFAENNYFNKKSGLLDQIGVAYGNIVAIDFKDIASPKVEEVVFPFKDLHFVLVNTGGSHAGMNDLYSSIPNDMLNAAKKMGHEFLRECNPDDVNLSSLSIIERKRAEHFFSENERVLSAIKAIKDNDEKAFLKAINESRLSSTDNLKNMMVGTNYKGSPLEACDRAMQLMKNDGACKINGGGFAGSIVCVVPEICLSNFIKEMSTIYGEHNVGEVFVRPYGPRLI